MNIFLLRVFRSRDTTKWHIVVMFGRQGWHAKSMTHSQHKIRFKTQSKQTMCSLLYLAVSIPQAILASATPPPNSQPCWSIRRLEILALCVTLMVEKLVIPTVDRYVFKSGNGVLGWSCRVSFQNQGAWKKNENGKKGKKFLCDRSQTEEILERSNER